MDTIRILELLSDLSKAGFTKAEITALIQSKPDAEKIKHPAPAEKPVEKVVETVDKSTEPDAPIASETETEKLVKALGLTLNTKLEALTNAIQNANVNNIEQNTANLMTSEDVIASIINPKYKEGK